MTKEEIKTNREFLVCQSNKLIQNTRYDLSAQQLKIINLLSSKIKPEDKDFYEYEFALEELCDIFGIQKQTANFKVLSNNIENLQKSLFKFENEEIKVTYSWITKAIIDKKNKKVVLELHKDLMPFLLQLSENYTNYELSNVLALDSRYSIRLYEILKSYSNLGELTIEIETLKKMFNCEDKYKEFKHFNNRVITPAIEELNKYTNITATVDYRREGRFIKSIHFTITEKKYGMDKINMMIERERKLENE